MIRLLPAIGGTTIRDCSKSQRQSDSFHPILYRHRMKERIFRLIYLRLRAGFEPATDSLEGCWNLRFSELRVAFKSSVTSASH
jgi:hypothetical protein